MSIFASRIQRVVELPFDVPHAVTIQKLSGRQLEKAKEANQVASVERLKSMGGAAFQRELAALNGDDAQSAALVARVRAQADPLISYDRSSVLRAGIKSWTYEPDLSTVTDEAKAVLIDDLSEEAADLLSRAILALTLPARGEDARKNG